MKVARIYFFGDSIMTGTYDPQGGWCDRFKQDMHKLTSEAQDGTKRQVYNLGIGGETSRGLVTRIESELKARHGEAWPAIVCIGTGKNDGRLRGGEIEVSLEEYEQNLRTIITKAHGITDKILLIGLGPCAEEVVQFKALQYTREQLARYDAVMKKVTEELSIPRIEIYDMLLEAEPTAFYRDQLHPSEYGYNLIYGAVKPALMELLKD
jgi:lysophospholipase L1-like esterase